jgi:SAM-dependent methyltransferase
MHPEAMNHGEIFFKTYSKNFENLTIVEIGSKNVNGSIKEFAPSSSKYIGLDFDDGNDVDIVITDPYNLPVEDNTADIVVTSSCFEHSQFFWLSFLEALRITKPSGIIYINAPSGGVYHRYPTDNWRFYPDAGIALREWGKASGYNPALLESFIGWQNGTYSNDFVSVFVKDKAFYDFHKERMLNKVKNPTNIFVNDIDEPINVIQRPQDERRVDYLIKNLFELTKHCGEKPELAEIKKFASDVLAETLKI